MRVSRRRRPVEAECRFDAAAHQYFIDGVQVPSITWMLDQVGLIYESDDEECLERGHLIHALAAELDQGAIRHPERVEIERHPTWKGYFLAYVNATRTLKPVWRYIEKALFHVAAPCWAGRLDRCGTLWGAQAVVELKTGSGGSPATPIQLALQALLAAPALHLPPTAILRYELILKETGRWALREHTNRRDFDEAAEIIRTCTT